MKSKHFLILFLFFSSIFSFAQDAKKYTTHIVKDGETLKIIAKQYDCKVKDLKDLNPDIDENNLVINTTLVVPRLASITKNENTVKVDQNQPKYHIVEAGNTLFSIAKKYNVTLYSLRDANNLKDDNLIVGSKLIIPSTDAFMIKPIDQKLSYYEVQKGDTKYSIAQKHNITVEQLDNINPNLNGELKEHDVIWVPLIEKSDLDNADNQDSTFIYHVVKEKENVFRIAVLYDVSQEEIESLNPEAVKMLRPGMLLKIPGKKKDKLVTHYVEKGDTFYSITRKYNVTETDLIALNPSLKDGLKYDTTIYIKPKGKAIALPNDKVISSNEMLNVSFLLPMMAEKTINYKADNSDTKLRIVVADFYLGAQMAIEKLESEGLKINYHVYDTKNSTDVALNLAKNNEVKNSHLIIGPLFFENAVAIADALPETPIIYPIYSKKQDTEERPNLIKVGIEEPRKTDVLVQHLLSNYTGQNILTITDNKESNRSEALFFEQLLKDKNLSFKRLELGEMPTTPDMIKVFQEKIYAEFNNDKTQWVVLFSEHKNYNTEIVKALAEKNKEIPVKIFSNEYFESNSQDFASLSAMEWTFPEIQFQNFKNAEVINFKKAFNDKNYSYPGSFAFTGYDVTYDVIKRMSEGNFYLNLQNNTSQGLIQLFDYNRTYESEFANHGIMLIKLNTEQKYELIKP